MEHGVYGEVLLIIGVACLHASWHVSNDDFVSTQLYGMPTRDII